MNRRFFLQAAGTTALALLTHSCRRSPAPSVYRSSLKAIEGRGYMVVATENHYPPFEFLVNDRPTGYDYDLLALLRKVAPFEIRQEILPWQEILPGVESGRFDLALSAVGITDKRATTLDFTMPIAESTIAYVKRQTDTSIRNLQDLAGKRIGVQQEGLSLATVPELQKSLQSQNRALVEIRQYRDFDAAYLDLIHSQIDAVLNNVVSLSVLVDEKLDLFEMGDRVGPRSYAAWAVRKGNTDLLAFLNEFLARVRRTGQLAQLQEKWLRIVFEDLPTQPLLPGDRPIA
jgi:polar amino acid transport system substrate-binding protein